VFALFLKSVGMASNQLNVLYKHIGGVIVGLNYEIIIQHAFYPAASSLQMKSRYIVQLEDTA